MALQFAGCANVTLPSPAAPVEVAAAPRAPASQRPRLVDPVLTSLSPAPVSPLPIEPVLNVPEFSARPADLPNEIALAPDVDLWLRLRLGFALPDLDSERVDKWQQWYASRPDYVQRMTERAGRYLYHIVDEVSRRNLPLELALLPFIESAFNPQALSPARASGMWQFVPATGRDFDLKQNVFRDDRRDVLASTRAALDYLQKLHGLLGDWHLALAAYNWGQGNVLRAVARNQREGLSTAYEHLRMPDETRNYLPKLQAIKNIVARPEAFSLLLSPLPNHPYFQSVPISQDMDVDVAARLAGLSLAEFRELNPQMNKPVILSAGTPQILLPYDNAHRFMQQLQQQRGSLASWTAWVAPRTLSVADAARQLAMPEARLRELNGIPPGMLVKAGSTLLVPRHANQIDDVAARVADQAALMLAPIKVAANAKASAPTRKMAATQNARLSVKSAAATPAVRVRSASKVRVAQR